MTQQLIRVRLTTEDLTLRDVLVSPYPTWTPEQFVRQAVEQFNLESEPELHLTRDEVVGWQLIYGVQHDD